MQASRYNYLNGVIIDHDPTTPPNPEKLLKMIMMLVGRGQLSGNYEAIIILLKKSFGLSTEDAQALYYKCAATVEVKDPFNPQSVKVKDPFKPQAAAAETSPSPSPV